MRFCICGKTILRPKERGHREREYGSVACRQRAYRERNKGKHHLDRIIKQASERMWNKVDQGIHRETWQDDLQRKEELISIFLSQLEAADRREDSLEAHIRLLDLTIANLHDQLAEKEAEIVRLNMLLDAQAKKKKHPSPQNG